MSAPNKRSYIRLNAIRALLLRGCRARRCVSSFVAPTGCCGYGSRCSIAAALTLITKTRPGRKRKVKLARVRDLLVPVLENPATVGQGHWTAVKLHGYLKEQLQLEFGYSTTVRWLHELPSARAATWPERQNEEAPPRLSPRNCKPCALIPKSSCGSGMNPASKAIRGAEDGYGRANPAPCPTWGIISGKNVIRGGRPAGRRTLHAHCGRRGHRRFPMLFWTSLPRRCPEGRRAAIGHRGQRLVAQVQPA
ncbi:MAG: hypothetical protein U1F83_01425 [Verrucomicrobiota bacterium]